MNTNFQYKNYNFKLPHFSEFLFEKSWKQNAILLKSTRHSKLYWAYPLAVKKNKQNNNLWEYLKILKRQRKIKIKLKRIVQMDESWAKLRVENDANSPPKILLQLRHPVLRIAHNLLHAPCLNSPPLQRRENVMNAKQKPKQQIPYSSLRTPNKFCLFSNADWNNPVIRIVLPWRPRIRLPQIS